MLIATLSVTVAGVLAACTTAVTGAASYGGSGPVVTSSSESSTESVPDPTSDSEDSSSPSGPSGPNSDGKCQAAYDAAQKFLPLWKEATASSTPTAEQRNAVATEMDLDSYSVKQILAEVKDPGLAALLTQLADELHNVSVLVVNGSAANLDNFKSLLDQVGSYCGL